VKTDYTQSSIALLPVAITAVIAAIGVAGMAYLFVAADRAPEGGVGMQSTSAAFRAGATITPTQPASGSMRPLRSITVADEARAGL
jgi:flagellar basal body-associated protein FliL